MAGQGRKQGQKRGIATKFLLVAAGLMLVMMVVLNLIMLAGAYKLQDEQWQVFITTLEAERVQQETLLREGLLQKGESLSHLISRTASGLIGRFEFAPLKDMAEDAVSDPEIAAVVIRGLDGSDLAAVRQAQTAITLEAPINDSFFKDDVIGSVEMHLDESGIRQSIAALGERIETLEREAGAAMREFGLKLAVGIMAAALLVVLIMCGALYLAVNRYIIAPMSAVVAGIDESAEQVAAASADLSSTSTQLADSASRQAASLEQTSASLDEISTMTRQNADNADQCDSLMREVNSVVEKASHSMEAQTLAMAEITKASEETSKIIKTIDEIAFQTNLLALNAAVEAARAGEAGAGFAVVADEVRNLAMRAAEAASSTASLIEGTVLKVRSGEELLQQTNANFSQVAEQATKAGTLVAEIATASREQSNGIGQVNQAITDIEQITQHIAANSQEAASASAQLSALGAHMHKLLEEIGAEGGGAGSGKKPASGRTVAGKAPRATTAAQSDRPRLPAPSPAATRSAVKSSAKPATGDAASARSKAAPSKKQEPAKSNAKEVIPFDEDDFEDF